MKCVIIGQDPYHGVNQAHGLCFSVKPEVEIPPSLVNIYKELQTHWPDWNVYNQKNLYKQITGLDVVLNGYLVKWAKQGVLLLNSVLTVRAHQANSHQGIGWEQFSHSNLYCYITHFQSASQSDLIHFFPKTHWPDWKILVLDSGRQRNSKVWIFRSQIGKECDYWYSWERYIFMWLCSRRRYGFSRIYLRKFYGFPDSPTRISLL